MSNKMILRHRSADVIHWTATAAKTVNTMQIVNNYVGVVLTAAAATGDVVPIGISGIYTLTKPTDVAFAQGAEVYTTSAGVLTGTDTANIFVGLAWAAATTGPAETNVQVHLKGAGVNALTI